MTILTDQQLADAFLSVASEIVTDVPSYAVPVHGDVRLYRKVQKRSLSFFVTENSECTSWAGV